METILLSPKNKKQIQQIEDFAKKLGISFNTLSEDDKEDAALLKAIQEVENDKRTVSLSTFLKKLRS